ncbi:MAG: hypothetical protein JKY49_06685 [Cohaesibacteraceae bacterium]|nr:hypothetical protein [Cohaesibacteraceae bacterium]MBL4877050.1 hypothetical protein [Cohaesibacteraceae bacterium]
MVWASVALALLKLLASIAGTAKARERDKGKRAVVVLEMLQQIIKEVEIAKQAEIDFLDQLRANPDWLLSDDGYKRTSNRPRDDPEGEQF